jgi:hypothetical protein
MHPLPPPNIPPELQHLRFHEMPEPYKTDIKHWIDSVSAHYAAREQAAKRGFFGALLVTIPLVVLAYVVLTRK